MAGWLFLHSTLSLLVCLHISCAEWHQTWVAMRPKSYREHTTCSRSVLHICMQHCLLLASGISTFNQHFLLSSTNQLTEWGCLRWEGVPLPQDKRTETAAQRLMRDLERQEADKSRATERWVNESLQETNIREGVFQCLAGARELSDDNHTSTWLLSVTSTTMHVGNHPHSKGKVTGAC